MLLLRLLAVGAIALATFQFTSPARLAHAETCADFSSAAEAQAFFNQDTSDPYDLDDDDDDIPCEDQFGAGEGEVGDATPAPTPPTPTTPQIREFVVPQYVYDAVIRAYISGGDVNATFRYLTAATTPPPPPPGTVYTYTPGGFTISPPNTGDGGLK